MIDSWLNNLMKVKRRIKSILEVIQSSILKEHRSSSVLALIVHSFFCVLETATNRNLIRILCWSMLVWVDATSTSPTMIPTVLPTTSPSSMRYPYNGITTLAGTGVEANSGTGGLATAAKIDSPRGIWVDSQGTVYWSEWSSSYCVRKFSTSNYIVVNVAGMCGATSGSTLDNIPATSAYLNVFTICVNSVGTLYAADINNNKVRTVSTSGLLATASGTGAVSTTSSGDYGPATSALVYGPAEVFVNPTDTLYIACTDAYLIRYVSGGKIYPLAGAFQLCTF